MNKKEEKELKINLEQLSSGIEEVYQLASLLTKFCEANKDSDDLYEVSLVTKIMQEKANKICFKIYNMTHTAKPKPGSLEQFEGKIVEFVD